MFSALLLFGCGAEYERSTVELTLEAGLALAVGIDQVPRLLVYAPRPRPVFGATLGYLF